MCEQHTISSEQKHSNKSMMHVFADVLFGGTFLQIGLSKRKLKGSTHLLKDAFVDERKRDVTQCNK